MGNLNFKLGLHIKYYVMSISSKSAHLLNPELCGENFETAFQALIISRLSYALSASCGFNTVEQC